MNTLENSPSFKKTDVVMLDGVQRIVMAKLQADATNPVMYSVCNALDLKGSIHGIPLIDATLVPIEALSESVRQRALYFA